MRHAVDKAQLTEEEGRHIMQLCFNRDLKILAALKVMFHKVSLSQKHP